MSKLEFCILAAAYVLCNGYEVFETTDSNNTVLETNTNIDQSSIRETTELWQRNDRIIASYREIFDNIATTVNDASDRQRRAYSIILSGILIYLVSNGDQSMTVDLSEPADVISSDLRNVLILMESVLNPMVEETKRLCRPTTRQEDCERKLNSFIKEQEQQCKGFSEHVRFWRTSLEFYNDRDYRRFICDVKKTSERIETDSEATSYVNQVTQGRKHREAITKLKVWFAGYSSGNYPCNLPPVKCSWSVTQKPEQTVVYVIREKHKRRHHHKHDSSAKEHHHHRDEATEQL